MRPLEIALLVVGLLAVAWPWRGRAQEAPRGQVVRRGRRILAFLAVAAVVVAVAQVLVEGPRWQLVPAYGVVALLAVWRLLRVGAEHPPRRGGRVVGVVLGGLGLASAALAAAVLPVPPLPTPDGPLAVGTTTWELRRTPDRPDPYREGPRRLVAQAWYPTEAAGRLAPWVSDAAAFSREVGPQAGLPGFTLRHVSLVSSGSVHDAPIAEGNWPVVVYSHGWGGFRTVQSDLAESLASEGFVVLALDHSSGAAVSLFPDGTAIPLDPTANPELEDVGRDAYVSAIQLLEETFAEDVAMLLDQLAAGAGPGELGANLRLDGVGLSGHSTGGGAMVRLCLTDERCGAVLGLDPWVEPVPIDLLESGLDVPVMSIRSEDWQGNANDGLLRRFHEASPGDAGLYVVPGSSHRDFTLLPFLTPLAQQVGLSGPVDPVAMHDAVDEVAAGFFGAHLRGDPPTDAAVAPVQRDP